MEKKIENVVAILKMRCGERICVRDDLKGASFDSTNTPMVADIMSILRACFTNADDIVEDLSWRGYFGIMGIFLINAEWRDEIDMALLEMSIKHQDIEKVRAL